MGHGGRGRVCTAVLNWNQPALTVRCVRELLAQDYPPGQAVLVIDNGSTAENVAALRADLPPGCRLVLSRQNLGFAGGMNVGIRRAVREGFEYVWLMNNDAFAGPGCLSALMGALDGDATLGAVGPRLTFPDGSPHPVGTVVDWETGALTQLIEPDEVPYPTPYGVDLVGTAPLIRVAALRPLGGFDRRFFAYREEHDLFARMLRSGRWNLKVVAEAGCVHLERASTGGGRSPLLLQLQARNGWLFVRKQLPLRRWPRVFLRMAAIDLLHAASFARNGNRAAAVAVVAGLYQAATNQYHRPRRLRAPGAVERFALEHHWGLVRLAWGLANRLAPAAQRRSLPWVGLGA